jgi:peroxiredoxin
MDKVYCANCKFINGRWKDEMQCSHEKYVTIISDWYSETTKILGSCKGINAFNNCKEYQSRDKI